LSVPSRQTFVVAACIALALGWGAVQWLPHPTVFAQPPEGPQLSVYSAQSSYVVPIVMANGQQYVGLVELLEPLGTVDARPDGKKYKLRFTAPGSRELELQFHDGKEKGKVGGKDIKLPANFAIQNNRGYVPLSSVSELLTRMLSAQIRYNPAARRLFIGAIEDHFTLDLRPGTPSKLFISFDSLHLSARACPGRRRPRLVQRFAHYQRELLGARRNRRTRCHG
jgi:hypothetical protein